MLPQTVGLASCWLLEECTYIGELQLPTPFNRALHLFTLCGRPCIEIYHTVIQYNKAIYMSVQLNNNNCRPLPPCMAHSHTYSITRLSFKCVRTNDSDIDLLAHGHWSRFIVFTKQIPQHRRGCESLLTAC